MKILILCTGNRCRSQMAQGILQNLDPRLEVHSAGIQPASEVHPLSIQVMAEIGVDLSTHVPKHIEQYLNEPWDYVITVCGGADKSCPQFTGEVGRRLHIGFDDPDGFVGSDEEKLNEFRRIRNEINKRFTALYNDEIKNIL